ncbi:hypothetical protein BBF96_04565 [Anoxybacter fermentans]|uniref:HTH-type transcriptional regulator MgrA n=1 Tax=Anoxybacter fermentans TaxID=1323375 RepID=A0A3Q9HPU9_9FIRM|nr:MarR family transcriptional regulator [Anoxybacter fermentans]AZR72726.1 hypothetical protein BBF96_04565 [Anoxybacter fermentans]
MDYFNLILKMLKTFHLLHQNLLSDFKNIDFDTNLNKTQRRVLMFLYCDGKNTMTSLCKKTELQRGSMTSVIDSLEELGLVQRTRSKDDRRQFFISLTQKGVQTAEKLKETMNLYLKRKLEYLTDDELQLFIQALDQLWQLNKKIGKIEGDTYEQA